MADAYRRLLGRGRKRSTRRPTERLPERTLDTPLTKRRRLVPRVGMNGEQFGRVSENLARFMGTPVFLLGMTIIVIAWLSWNIYAPAALQFDPRALNFTLLTLILSLQASYAAPLLLLAQNRQDDRDRVNLEQDRRNADRNLADTEFLTREIASLRLGLREVATRDYLRGEIRDLLEDLQERDTAEIRADAFADLSDDLRERIRREVRDEMRIAARDELRAEMRVDGADELPEELR